MRLLKSRNTAQEEITEVLNEGYSLLSEMGAERETRKADSTWAPAEAKPRHEEQVNEWGGKVQRVLLGIFPTKREWNYFLNPPHQGLSAIAADDNDDYEWQSLKLRLKDLINALDTLIEARLDSYTDVPLQKRLYIEDIDLSLIHI